MKLIENVLEGALEYIYKIKFQYLCYIRDYVLPNFIPRWYIEQKGNIEFKFIKYSTAYIKRTGIINEYLEVLNTISKNLNLEVLNEKINITYLPNNKLSQRLFRRNLNFTNMKSSSIYLLYNARVQATITHELTHIITYRNFNPLYSGLKLALFEGIAVLMTYKQNVNKMIIEYYMELHLEQIVKEVNEGKSYIEIGSFVYFLVYTYGIEGFFNICRNDKALEDIENHLNDYEERWKELLNKIKIQCFKLNT